MPRSSRRVNPTQEAKYFVRHERDKPGLKAVIVDEYIGKLSHHIELT